MMVTWTSGTVKYRHRYIPYNDERVFTSHSPTETHTNRSYKELVGCLVQEDEDDGFVHDD